MTTTSTDISSIGRIRPGREAATLASAVYAALLADLERLGPEEWDAPTVCSPWTVADMVRHLLGAAKGTASTGEFLRQQLLGFRRRREFGGNPLDAVNGLQVIEHRQLGPRSLVAQLRAIAPASVAWRTSRPGLLDRIAVPAGSGGSAAAGSPSAVRLGDLFRVVYTRDSWLHRIDIARAVGRPVRLEQAVDGRIVEDVVREWAGRHGKPFELTLTGDLEAHYRSRGGGPRLELDALALCWVLSGRADPDPASPGSDLLLHRVLF